LIQLPGQSFNGFILNNVVCEACKKKNKNILGLFYPSEKYKVYHPMYNDLYSAGYTKYLPPEKIRFPDDPFEL